VLAFFAGSDGIVLENLAVRFMQGEGRQQQQQQVSAACIWVSCMHSNACMGQAAGAAASF
jgi:hypothetical protein